MTIQSEEISCPNCQNIMEIRTINSMYIYAYMTNMRPIGACSSIPMHHECERCHYMFYDEDIQPSSAFIESMKYTDLYTKYHEEKPFLLIAEIYKNLGLVADEIEQALLYNYYKGEEIEDFKLLVDHYLSNTQELFLFPNNKSVFKLIMIGEYYRITKQETKAKDIFSTIVKMEGIKDFYHDMAAYQLKLLMQKRYETEEYCGDVEPDYQWPIPALDGEIDRTLSDQENIAFYLDELHDNLRYDEFEKGIKNLLSAGVDIHAFDEDGNMLFHILYLLAYRKSNCVQDKILEIFQTALEKYDLDPTVLGGDLNHSHMIGFLKFDLGREFDINKAVVPKMQDILFSYTVKLIKSIGIINISSTKQHILLMMQLPDYNKVKELITLGLRFNLDLSVYDEYDNDVLDLFSYTDDWWYRERLFKKTTLPFDLYSLLLLFLEYSNRSEKQRMKILKRIEIFKEYLTSEEFALLKEQL